LCHFDSPFATMGDFSFSRGAKFFNSGATEGKVNKKE